MSPRAQSYGPEILPPVVPEIIACLPRLYPRLPRAGRVVFLDTARHFRSVHSQISLEHDALLADDECHQTRVAILHWRGDHRESARHFPVDDVLLCAARCLAPLRRQNAKRIPVDHRRFVWREERVLGKILHPAEWACILTLLNLPVKTILFPWSAEDFAKDAL